MADTRLRQIRRSLNVSQEGIARRTRSVSTGTVKNAENGRPVKVDTANQLLEAINAILAEHDQETITLEDLGLELY